MDAAEVGDVAELDPGAKEGLRTGVFETLFGAALPFAQVPEAPGIVVLGQLIEFRQGPATEVVADDSEPLGSVIAVIEPTTVEQGDVAAGEPIYVRVPIDDLEGLRAVAPEGTDVLVAAEVLSGDHDAALDDPARGVPEGETRYLTGAPVFAIADGDERSWFPLMGITLDQPLADGLARQ